MSAGRLRQSAHFHISGDWQWSHCRAFTSRTGTAWGFGNLQPWTGKLVIRELIVRTTDTNLGYNANQKVWTFYATKRGPYTCLCICNTEMTFITIQNTVRNRLSVHVTKIPRNYTCPLRGSYLHYTGPTYMPNQQINTAQTETHSKYCLVLYTNIFIHHKWK